MHFLDPREVIAFPGGDNSSDTIISNVHLNKTTLDFWNYTLYSNGTMSNGTDWCLLTFAPHQPAAVLENGTFVNVTWCWTPAKPIEARAGIGVGFSVLFGVALICNLLGLTKHGKMYLPAEKRFYPIGRRWQWYWGSFACGAALIALLTGIDVDRYWLPELPVILTSFFWYLMQIGSMALVWEAVRHWGSWMERQFIDPDPFALRQDDRRSKTEFYLPLVAYLWLWLSFFLTIPRNWDLIKLQRFPEQTRDVAIPAATDGRFKAAPFCLFITWCITMFSLWHSIKHYRARERSVFHRTLGFFSYTPWRFLLILPISFAIPLYMEMVAWKFDWSPLNINGNNIAIYVGGYVPTLLIVLIQSVFAYFNPNEDKELLRQRRVRGRALNEEMGIVPKPGWWSRLNSEGLPGESMRDIIARNVAEVGGRKPRTQNVEEGVPSQDAAITAPPPALLEMERINTEGPVASPVAPGHFTVSREAPSVYTGRSDARLHENTTEPVSGMMDGPIPSQPPPPYEERGRPPTAAVNGSPAADRSISVDTENTLTNPPQQIRSMLDL